MPSTSVIFLLLSPVLLFALWHLTTTIIPPPPNATLSNKRIILLIAHPDDESMFFSPTLQSLTDPSLGNHLKILCMSTGNADGLGETRKRELEKAAITLGLRRREDVFIMDDPRFRDGMEEQWDEKEIARVLASAFAPQLNQTDTIAKTTPAEKETSKFKLRSSKSKSASTPKSPIPTPLPGPEGPRATIDVLITFDSHGISNHPNHIALYHGARLFLSNIMHGHSGYACPVTLYTLPTVNIVRKYSFILDVVPTLLCGIWRTMVGTSNTGSGQAKAGKAGAKVLFVNDVSKYWKARDAMINGHKSQMVWFRWGWIGLGRYMVVNDLKREKIVGT